MVSTVAQIGHYVPSEQVVAKVAGMILSPIGPAHATHHTTSIGHSVWFKRQKSLMNNIDSQVLENALNE